MKDIIKFPDFEKLDLRVATILKAEDIEGADKLYKLTIDLGDTENKKFSVSLNLGKVQDEKRTIVAGIKQNYDKKELKGKQIIVVANLEARKLKGIESHGMLLAASNEDHTKIILLSPEKKAENGWKVS